jgi:hypothetical protein
VRVVNSIYTPVDRNFLVSSHSCIVGSSKKMYTSLACWTTLTSHSLSLRPAPTGRITQTRGSLRPTGPPRPVARSYRPVHPDQWLAPTGRSTQTSGSLRPTGPPRPVARSDRPVHPDQWLAPTGRPTQTSGSLRPAGPPRPVARSDRPAHPDQWLTPTGRPVK